RPRSTAIPSGLTRPEPASPTLLPAPLPTAAPTPASPAPVRSSTFSPPPREQGRSATSATIPVARGNATVLRGKRFRGSTGFYRLSPRRRTGRQRGGTLCRRELLLQIIDLGPLQPALCH